MKELESDESDDERLRKLIKSLILLTEHNKGCMYSYGISCIISDGALILASIVPADLSNDEVMHCHSVLHLWAGAGFPTYSRPQWARCHLAGCL